jgi:hypothetical protein
MPTVLELAGITEAPPGLDAVSLVPLIRAEVDTLSLRTYASFPFDPVPGSTLLRIIRSERAKLFHRPERPDRDQLYDVEHDPGEHVNLAKTRPGLRATMLAELNAISAKLAAEGRRGRPPTPRALLRADPVTTRTVQAGTGTRLGARPAGISVVPADRDRLLKLVVPLPGPTPRASMLLLRAEVDAGQTVSLVALAGGQEELELPEHASATAHLEPGGQTLLVQLPAPAGSTRLTLVLLRPVPLVLHALEVIDLGGSPEAAAPGPDEAAGSRTTMDPETEAQLRALGYLGG